MITMGKLERYLQQQKISEEEAIIALNSRGAKPKDPVVLGLSNTHIKFGVISDTHIGHKCFVDALFEKAAKHFKKEGVEFVAHPGDHLEGMSGRPGHVYELNLIGFAQQVDRAVELYSSIGKPIYGIDGNHDGWYYKKNDNGTVVGEVLEQRVKGYKHLGQMEGVIQLGQNAKMLLYHGGDGSAYATSYKLQKLVESFDGGDKPNIVLSGHYHKSMYAFIRNVHAFEAGTL